MGSQNWDFGRTFYLLSHPYWHVLFWSFLSPWNWMQKGANKHFKSWPFFFQWQGITSLWTSLGCWSFCDIGPIFDSASLRASAALTMEPCTWRYWRCWSCQRHFWCNSFMPISLPLGKTHKLLFGVVLHDFSLFLADSANCARDFVDSKSLLWFRPNFTNFTFLRWRQTCCRSFELDVGFLCL